MIRKINNTNLRNFTDGTTYTVSLTTSETITASVAIPGGTFKNGDILSIDAAVFRFTSSSTFSTRLYYNSTLSLTGAIQLGVAPSVLSTISYRPISRTLSIRTANGTGSGVSLGTEVPATGTTIGSEFISTSVSNLPIDWTTDGFIFSTITPTNSLTTLRQYYLKVWTY